MQVEIDNTAIQIRCSARSSGSSAQTTVDEIPFKKYLLHMLV